MLEAAENAIDQVRADWAAAIGPPRSFITGREEIEDAHFDGVELLASVFKLLAD